MLLKLKLSNGKRAISTPSTWLVRATGLELSALVLLYRRSISLTNIRFTGAGQTVTNILAKEGEAPAVFNEAMDAICRKAKARDCRVWIDAEQQIIQGKCYRKHISQLGNTTRDNVGPCSRCISMHKFGILTDICSIGGIDKWTIDLMRKWNTDGNVLVYNTIQSYLKASRTKLKEQLALASKENWTLAVKLVRGAYIATDYRDRIHDTKKDTDESYDGIVRDLLTGSNLGFAEGHFPDVRLFLAGHNPNSVAAALDRIQTLSEQGKLKCVPDFGQLQGMSDELGCKVLKTCAEFERKRESGSSRTVVPRIYKCLTWGSIQECMQYLYRRVVENSGGTDRMKDGLSAYRLELRGRAFGR